MTAPLRLEAARFADLFDRAVEVRREWLRHGLSTAPADRPAAENAIARIYARHRRHRPRFVWAASPHKALPLLDGRPGHAELARWIAATTPQGEQRPLLSDILAGQSQLRSALDAAADDPRLGSHSRTTGKDKKPWPRFDPTARVPDIPLREILHQCVREPLQRTLSYHIQVRASLGENVPSACYGQLEAPWIAYYDALARLGLARYASADADRFDDWAALARTAGWWWPDVSVCVLIERPSIVDTAPLRGARHEELQVNRVIWP